MNVLLFVPGLAVVLVMNVGWRKAVLLGVLFIAVQVGLGLPFLLDSPYAYIKGAFDLGRQFFYVWTVNWRCLPEKVFLDRRFQTALLSMHLSTLLAFCHWCWLRGRGGIPALFSKDSWSGGANAFSPTEIVRILFTSNFIGMVFSRSLHYQFYVWYFHTLPWLLWQTSAPMALRYVPPVTWPTSVARLAPCCKLSIYPLPCQMQPKSSSPPRAAPLLLLFHVARVAG